MRFYKVSVSWFKYSETKRNHNGMIWICFPLHTPFFLPIPMMVHTLSSNLLPELNEKCIAGKAHLREALLLHEEALRVNRMCRELRKKEHNQTISITCCIWKAAQKVPSLVVRPLRGGGVKARPLRKKNFF